ncbi:MAG: adenylyl-sulfate kinase, partial [Myxococcales bacterium]
MQGDLPSERTGLVLWITGLSGAGKSTLAALVVDQLRATCPNVVLLDGDAFRALMGDGLGHTPDARLENAFRLARFARHLSRQGLIVVCATMSLFPEVWRWNRSNLPRYFEVYLRVPFGVLEKRDPKGLYGLARN